MGWFLQHLFRKRTTNADIQTPAKGSLSSKGSSDSNKKGGIKSASNAIKSKGKDYMM